MNVYCKIDTQEDYDYFFQYDPIKDLSCPCLFNIDTLCLGEDKRVGILIEMGYVIESNAEWITVEKMKQLAFIRSLEL